MIYTITLFAITLIGCNSKTNTTKPDKNDVTKEQNSNENQGGSETKSDSDITKSNTTTEEEKDIVTD